MGTRKLGRFSESAIKPLNGTPVLTYHGFTGGNESHARRRELKYSISSFLFQEHMRFLQDACFASQTVPDFWAARAGSQSQQTVVLSFDDGRSSDYEIAFPMLLEAAMTATFFVNTSTVGRSGYLTWSRIDEMQRFGMSFQSHSHEHVYLSRIPEPDLQRQLHLSKLSIEEHTGAPVQFLAAPYGDVSSSVVQAASEAGYSAVCTSHSWPARPGRPTINRIVVYGSSTIERFRRLVACDRCVYTGRVARQTCLYLVKELLFLCRNPARQEQPAAL
jgi:peptidoglycan/xylan/chitin deacetylase (PgdA/CDA1 family)